MKIISENNLKKLYKIGFWAGLILLTAIGTVLVILNRFRDNTGIVIVLLLVSILPAFLIYYRFYGRKIKNETLQAITLSYFYPMIPIWFAFLWIILFPIVARLLEFTPFEVVRSGIFLVIILEVGLMVYLIRNGILVLGTKPLKKLIQKDKTEIGVSENEEMDEIDPVDVEEMKENLEMNPALQNLNSAQYDEILKKLQELNQQSIEKFKSELLEDIRSIVTPDKENQLNNHKKITEKVQKQKELKIKLAKEKFGDNKIWKKLTSKSKRYLGYARSVNEDLGDRGMTLFPNIVVLETELSRFVRNEFCLLFPNEGNVAGSSNKNLTLGYIQKVLQVVYYNNENNAYLKNEYTELKNINKHEYQQMREKVIKFCRDFTNLSDLEIVFWVLKNRVKNLSNNNKTKWQKSCYFRGAKENGWYNQTKPIAEYLFEDKRLSLYDKESMLGLSEKIYIIRELYAYPFEFLKELTIIRNPIAHGGSDNNDNIEKDEKKFQDFIKNLLHVNEKWAQIKKPIRP